ncbi:MAG: hypothetical protein H0W02_22555 [Ktedonobacteraceae bacterium]|nr:hypothetical protein [Ktedonobacteraceae bacterium]
MSESEVARLRRLVEQEYEAARRGLEGLAIVANHEFINARMGAIERHHRRLVRLVGEEQAIQIVGSVFGVP